MLFILILSILRLFIDLFIIIPLSLSYLKKMKKIDMDINYSYCFFNTYIIYAKEVYNKCVYCAHFWMTIFINDYTIRIMLMEKKYVDTRSDNVFTIIPLSLQCKNWGVWGSRRREEMRWTWHNDMMKSLVGIMWIVLVLISGTYDQSTIFLTKFYCRPEYSNWSFAKRILQLSSIFFS